MNIGDYVYLYLFDLNKHITGLKQLRDDRFGRIITIKTLIINNVEVKEYHVKLLYNNSMVTVRDDNINTKITTIDLLVSAVNNSSLSEELKQKLLNQIQTNIN